MPGVLWQQQILTDQLILSQPGGQTIPKHPPGFSDLPSALDSKNLNCQPQMNQVPWMNR
jgi:hypothetical protein